MCCHAYSLFPADLARVELDDQAGFPSLIHCSVIRIERRYRAQLCVFSTRNFRGSDGGQDALLQVG
ncbi:Uncharacterised protein [Serratia fonticola]|uniref:Uncharacterized protein n=1 Tax=Serratia fonticola TaxID=47917 RepID=A0A4V6KN31_SERFO|nr:Uncharacterised protein [Serratia fonticola]VTR27348.1 Uncharacterised protein [Serratia fonticola]